MNNELTEDEIILIQKLAECWDLFNKLPITHPNDSEEFSIHIHSLQRQVMSRLARRIHPEMFLTYKLSV